MNNHHFFSGRRDHSAFTGGHYLLVIDDTASPQLRQLLLFAGSHAPDVGGQPVVAGIVGGHDRGVGVLDGDGSQVGRDFGVQVVVVDRLRLDGDPVPGRLLLWRRRSRQLFFAGGV